jgi:hypothetical protein
MKALITALAIALSTPAAAATISLASTISTFQVTGSDTTPTFSIGLPSVTLIPAPLDAHWEYFVDVMSLTPPTIGLGGIIASGCSPFPCFPEPRGGGGLLVHARDFVRFGYFWFGNNDGSFARPEIQLTFNWPEGVTLTQTPLPASWLLFGSVLGLTGWLRSRRLAHVARACAS